MASKRKRTELNIPYIARNFPRWLHGFEKRIINQIAMHHLAIQSLDSRMRGLGYLLEDSKPAREDNVPTLWALRRILERIEATQREHTKTLAAHCERLLREKETLIKMTQADKLRATPVLTGSVTMPWQDACAASVRAMNARGGSKCTWAHLHRPGTQCAICGHLEIVYPSPRA